MYRYIDYESVEKIIKYCEINVVPVLLIQADTLQNAKEFMENQGGRGDED